MSILKELEEYSDSKDNAASVLLSALLLICPAFVFLFIYFPILISELDVFKLLAIAVVSGLITILPTMMALMLTSDTSFGLKMPKEQMTLFAFVAAVSIVVPLQIAWLIVTYFVHFQVQFFLMISILFALALPIFLVAVMYSKRRKN